MRTVHDHQGRDSVKCCAERVWDMCEPVYLRHEVHTTLRLGHHLFLNVLVEPYTLTQRRFTGESLWPEAERKKVHQPSSPRRGCSQNSDTTSFLSCTGKDAHGVEHSLATILTSEVVSELGLGVATSPSSCSPLRVLSSFVASSRSVAKHAMHGSPIAAATCRPRSFLAALDLALFLCV